MINRNHFKLFIWAAFLWGCFFLVSCENDQGAIDEWTGNKELIEEAVDINTFISQGSRMKARLTAPSMLRFQSDTNYLEFPKSLHVDFFDSGGKVESQLGCLYGRYYEALNKVYLRDSVTIFNSSGDSLRTPELWWDQNTQRFYTDKRVRIRKSGHLIFGLGMEAKQDLSDIVIHKVTGTVWVPDSVSSPTPSQPTMAPAAAVPRPVND